MPQRITTDFLAQVRPLVYSTATEYSKRFPGLRYCDLRLEVRESTGAMAENGHDKISSEDYAFSLGVRVMAGRRAVAPGYYGKVLGATDADRLEQVLREALEHAYRRAMANSRGKEGVRRRLGGLGETLRNIELAPVRVCQDTVLALYKTDPRAVPLASVAKMALEGCKAAQGISDQIVYCAAGTETFILRELFASSEGADIDHSFALTEGMVFVVSRGKNGNLELYDFTGHQRGWEVLTEGYHNGPLQLPDFVTFCKKLASDAVEVSNAPPLKPPDKDVVVVTDPHFNTLLVHEVVGHPSELDRALKYETSYAGRSWLFKDLKQNQIGQQVASPLVSAYSDPTMEGYGFYRYDHEGTPARRAYHIRDGEYEEFLNSRQTASVLGVEPNGSYRATEGCVVPLIRMSNTVFAPGDRDPQEVLAEVEDGYYISGHRVPSIAESRENFRITAVKVYEIKNGQLGQLYRDGGIMSDSRDYFMRVDAVGNDFRMYPIPNCGKGQPMQTKRMSNGGPTMRSIARLTGAGT